MTQALASIDERTTTPARVALRWVEFAVLFVGAPLPFVLGWLPMRWLMPALLGFAAVCLAVLLMDRRFERRRLWHMAGLRRELPRIGVLFTVGVPAMAGLLAVLIGLRERGLIAMHENVQWFALPRQQPVLWWAIMFGYPLVSVYPQELIYRAFLFHRYRAILPTPTARVLAGAVVFGWVHIVFMSADPVTGLPVALCVLGGVLFGWSYERGRSLAAAWLEHGLYGCAVFTLGLGWLFYGGSVRAAAEAVGP